MQQQNTQNVVLMRDRALEYVQSDGPLLPVQVSKHIGSDLMLAGAILSELSSRKLILLTHANVGGSPLYYVKGQESKLSSRLYNSLKSKEKEVFTLLDKEKVLKDEDLEPAHRVAISNLKDFAVKLDVIQDNKSETFWKYSLIEDSEAKNLIENLLKNDVVQEIPVEVPKEIHVELPKPEIKQQVTTQIEKPIKPIKQKQKDNFYGIIREYLSKNKINVLEETIIKKQSEFEFIVNIPSSVGNLKYFIKAKNKASINDVDISLAYSESHQKKLPCLFITKGKLTKKAVDLEKKLTGQITLKQI